MAAPRPFNEQYSDSAYLNDKRLRKPSVGEVTLPRNISVTKRRNDRRGVSNGNVRITKRQTSEAYNYQKSDPRDNNIRNTRKEQPNGSQGEKLDYPGTISQKQLAEVSQRNNQRFNKKVVTKIKEQKGKKLLKKAEVFAINNIARWPLLFFWGMWQVWFALWSVIFLTLSLALSSLVGNSGQEYNEETGVGGFIIYGLGKGFKFLADAVNFAAKEVLGFDLGALFDPMNVVILCILAIWPFAILQYLLLMLIYSLGGINPMFGKGGGIKTSAFILGLVGYALPIFNLVPWIMIWMIAVAKYPE